ncbi:MAG: hypothetical protein R3293_23435 [Candidatus Promineifilaceae bacterium]|nr:hypothetical protein [Candidatus Promineifilaceae bacterium]
MTQEEYDKINAQQAWQQARRRVLYKEVVCLIKRCSVDLLSFNQVRRDLHLQQQQYMGQMQIPLDKIKGSVGRYDDFDAAFMPRKDFLKERWQGVEIAMMHGKTPPIDLYQVGNDFFVVDGNHRVSVARQLGLDTIEAYVTRFEMVEPLDDHSAINNELISAEQHSFLEKSGVENRDIANSITFTCAGCFGVLTKQIEDYREGVERLEERPVSFSEAFSAWNDEVYAPSIAKIRENQLIDKFPDRTEADLFVWTSQHSDELENIEKSAER